MSFQSELFLTFIYFSNSIDIMASSRCLLRNVRIYESDIAIIYSGLYTSKLQIIKLIKFLQVFCVNNLLYNIHTRTLSFELYLTDPEIKKKPAIFYVVFLLYFYHSSVVTFRNNIFKTCTETHTEYKDQTRFKIKYIIRFFFQNI